MSTQKPKHHPTIKTVLEKMTFSSFVDAAERTHREAMANVRFQQIEAEAATRAAALALINEEIIQNLGYPEYRSAKHAQRKHKKAERHRKSLLRAQPTSVLVAEMRLKKRAAAMEVE